MEHSESVFGFGGRSDMTMTLNDKAAGNPAADNRTFTPNPRLFRLPKLPTRASAVVANKSASMVCVNCRKVLKTESEFSQNLRVCAECLAVYSLIDRAINHRAEEKIRAAKFREFAAKMGA